MTERSRPRCECGIKLQCRDCDDNRPTAGDIYAGWQIRSPFDRWETVTRTEHPEIGPVRIWTAESGDRAWTFYDDKHLDATPPRQNLHGEPEVRVMEFDGANKPMAAVACLSTDHRMHPGGDSLLVFASTSGRGRGWTVSYRSDDASSSIVTEHDSKPKARSELRRVARQLAKRYGVRLALPEKKGP